MATDEELMKQQQEADQTNSVLRSMSGAYVPPQDKYAGAIITLTDPSDDIEKFKMFLQSRAYDREGNVYQVGKPLMNEEGINAILSIINSVVYRTNSMTNYDSNYLETLFDNIKADLISNLMTKRLQYEIDRKDRFLIMGDTLRFIWGFTLKSLDEGERKFWKGSTQEIRHTQQVDGKTGMSMNPFNMWRKK